MVEKGVDYGEVDPVMLDADVYGWALGVSRGARLSPVDRQRLGAAADELERSLSAFPPEAQAYYERLFRIARLCPRAVVRCDADWSIPACAQQRVHARASAARYTTGAWDAPIRPSTGT